MKTNRRKFIKSAGILAGSACLATSGLCSCSMMEGVSNTPAIPATAVQMVGDLLTIMLDAVNGLKAIGGKGKLTIAKNNGSGDELKLIIVHPEKDVYKVFADSCTHGGRELNYKNNEKHLICSSFGHSTYDLNGNVLSGPAPSQLKQFESTLKDNQLIICCFK